MCFPFDAVILDVKKGRCGGQRSGVGGLGVGGWVGGGLLDSNLHLLCGFGKLSVAFPLVM